MRFTFDGQEIPIEGEPSIAAALVRHGLRPRYFCGIGICFACLVTVNGRPARRACLVTVRPGDRVES